MKLCLVLLSCVAAAWAVNDAGALDLSTLMSAGLFGRLGCAEPCISDLVYAAKNLLFFKDTVKNFEELCTTYSNASLCMAEKEVSCLHSSSFTKDSSGWAALCAARAHEFNQKKACVDQKIDYYLNECDARCLFTPALADVSRRESVKMLAKQGGDKFALYQDMEELCPATSCFMSCMAAEINQDCAPAGSDIVTALLRPFFMEAEMLSAANKTVMEGVVATIPSACMPFIQEDSLKTISNGKFHSLEQTVQVSEMHDRALVMEGEEDREPISKSDISTLLEAAGVPSCSDSCLTDLLFAVDNVLQFKDTIKNFKHLCQTYANASLCIARQEQTCIHYSSFSIGAAAIEQICDSKKDQFAAFESCLEPVIDASLVGCDQMCSFTSAVDGLVANSIVHEAVQTGGNRMGLYQELAPLCPATGCMISCISRTLNRQCENSGSEIATALLRPFTLLTDMLAKMGPEIVKEAQAGLPPQCFFFVNRSALSDIAHGIKDEQWKPVSMTDRALETEADKETMLQENVLVQDKNDVDQIRNMENHPRNVVIRPTLNQHGAATETSDARAAKPASSDRAATPTRVEPSDATTTMASEGATKPAGWAWQETEGSSTTEEAPKRAAIRLIG